MKQKTFVASLVNMIWLAIPVLVASATLYWRWNGTHKDYEVLFMYDPVFLFFCTWALLILAAALPLILILIAVVNSFTSVTITPATFTYKSLGKEFTCTWPTLIVTPSHAQKGIRAALLSDGNQHGVINSFFFPQYDMMIELFQAAKQTKAARGYDI